MLYDVTFEVSIPGIKTTQLTRTVDAPTLEQALVKAQGDICRVSILSVVPNDGGIAVMPGPLVADDVEVSLPPIIVPKV